MYNFLFKLQCITVGFPELQNKSQFFFLYSKQICETESELQGWKSRIMEPYQY